MDRVGPYQRLGGSGTREPAEVNRAILQLVRLAQEATNDTVASREGHGLERVEAEVAERWLQGRARRNKWSWPHVAGLACVIAFAAIALTMMYRRSNAGVEGENRSLSSEKPIRATVVDDVRIGFADGTEAVLDKGARATIAEVHPRGSRIVLEDGKAHFCVTPAGGAKWLVEAGPYSIHVAGSVFDVAWTGAAASLDLWLHAGSVTIFGPLIPSGLAVQPGQHLITDAETVVLIDTRVATVTR